MLRNLADHGGRRRATLSCQGDLPARFRTENSERPRADQALGFPPSMPPFRPPGQALFLVSLSCSTAPSSLGR